MFLPDPVKLDSPYPRSTTKRGNAGLVNTATNTSGQHGGVQYVESERSLELWKRVQPLRLRSERGEGAEHLWEVVGSLATPSVCIVEVQRQHWRGLEQRRMRSWCLSEC